MIKTVIITKDFVKSLQIYWITKKSLVLKVLEIKNHLENFWFDIQLFQQYDIKNLWNNYFRVKFIPYRIIIFMRDNNTFEFVELFKRKGKSDYKKYNSPQ